jgi:ectoine hydroxylase-related dioxygenase (phytanoyl-CoA dioxygenase family)
MHQNSGRLSAEQKQFYADNGYLILRDWFPKDKIARLRRNLFDLLSKPWEGSQRLTISYEQQARGKDPENPLGAWFVGNSPLLDDMWFKLTLDQQLVAPMIDLLGPDINLHDQKIVMKPPGHISDQRWHQDWPYEVHDRPELAAILLYLDDTAPGAGATKLVQGSHKRGALPHDRADGSKSIPDEIFGDDYIQPAMQGGDAIIIHTYLVHSVGDNLTDQTKVLVAHVYKTMQAVDTHGNHRALAELPVARNGKPALAVQW